MEATTIKFSGMLAKEFGREHKVYLDTRSPREALRWWLSQFPVARTKIMDMEKAGLGIAIFRGKIQGGENIGFDKLDEPAGGLIRFAPAVAGAKQGGLQTIIGVALIVVASIYSGGTAAAFSSSGLWGGAVATTGLALAVGGVVTMLSPQPKMGTKGDSPDNQPSDIFNGAVNTTAQGNCVPVLYGGPMEIGSVVISAGIEAVDYSSRPSSVTPGTELGNWRKTPYDPE